MKKEIESSIKHPIFYNWISKTHMTNNDRLAFLKKKYNQWILSLFFLLKKLVEQVKNTQGKSMSRESM